jgi:hypothetical protein
MGGYVTLWHGSPLENLESILENGIVPNKSKVDAEERVEQAIYEIAERLKLGGEAVHENARATLDDDGCPRYEHDDAWEY